jgi:hypothetical protein
MWEIHDSEALHLCSLLEKKQKQKQTKTYQNKVPVVHTCNPSNSGGRDQADHSPTPALANSPQDPILKNTQHKKGWQSGSNSRAHA